MQLNKVLKGHVRVTAHSSRATAVQCRSQKSPIDMLKASGLGAAAIIAASPSVAYAADALAIADNSSISMAVSGGVAIVGLGAVLVATDPQKRYSECGNNEIGVH